MRKTRVLGVKFSVPNGAYAVTAGAGAGNTTRVAAAFRAKVGVLARAGESNGFNAYGPIAGTGGRIGTNGLNMKLRSDTGGKGTQKGDHRH